MMRSAKALLLWLLFAATCGWGDNWSAWRGANGTGGFFRKSDLAFGAGFALALWLLLCYSAGANRYELMIDLSEEIRVAGVVRMPKEAVPHLCEEAEGDGKVLLKGFFYTSDVEEGSGSSVPARYDTRLGGFRYEFPLTVGHAWAHSRGEGWEGGERHVRAGIHLSLAVPSGWRAYPPRRLIRGATSTAGFAVRREHP